MQFFLDTAETDAIRAPPPHRPHRRHHDQPLPHRQERTQHQRSHRRDCRSGPRPDLRRGHGDRGRGHDPRGQASGRHCRERRRQAPLDRSGDCCLQAAGKRGARRSMSPSASRPAQAILAAKAGARYISPFVGRLGRRRPRRHGPHRRDCGDLRRAKLRNASAGRFCAPPDARRPSRPSSGAQVATLPPKLLHQLLPPPPHRAPASPPSSKTGKKPAKRFCEFFREIGMRG